MEPIAWQVVISFVQLYVSCIAIVIGAAAAVAAWRAASRSSEAARQALDEIRKLAAPDNEPHRIVPMANSQPDVHPPDAAAAGSAPQPRRRAARRRAVPRPK